MILNILDVALDVDETQRIADSTGRNVWDVLTEMMTGVRPDPDLSA